jgi:replication factor C subunit 2/4
MIMTEYSNTTRFALACNDSSKLIEPIQSRCAIVRFTKLSDEEMLKRLKTIMDKENFNHTTDGFEALIFTAEGDMRYALNNL